jgi:hypothetical protein
MCTIFISYFYCNYLLKYLIGFPVKPPYFMLKNKTEKEKGTLLTSSPSDGSDSEWTPAIVKVKKSKGEHSG